MGLALVLHTAKERWPIRKYEEYEECVTQEHPLTQICK